MENKQTRDPNVLEFRRLRALELYEAGMIPARIAEVLGVTPGAVSQWISTFKSNGRTALLKKRSGTKPCRLSLAQKEELHSQLEAGAQAHGYPDGTWTRARVKLLILKLFGIEYHITQVGRILRLLGFTWQKPSRQAIQRNEEMVEDWRAQRWEAIKKSP